MSNEVMEIEGLIPTMTKEQISQARRAVSIELILPPEEKKSFGEILRNIIDERGIDMESILTATGIDDKSYYRYRSKKDDTVPKVETLIRLCVGLRMHRVQIDYVFALLGYQIKLNDPNYDIYQYYFDYCAVKKELTVSSLLKEIKLAET
mgnify:CR=1 FL=1